MRILSGIKPTGDQFHIGNYLGAVKEWVREQDENTNDEHIYFIPNLHALTSMRDGKALRENTTNIVLQLIAAGIDPDKSIIYRQSDIPFNAELTWILNCLCPMGLLERAHSYKDSVAKGKDINVGVFDYPVLMTSDIILYQVDRVPVGADQKQHVEIARDLAIKFNNAYGETFKLPEPLIKKEVGTIPGTDGQKMSKSYGNTIGVFEDESSIKKKVMAIVTDSKAVEEPKDPETCNVFQLLKHFAPQNILEDVRAKYLAGGIGYGDTKKILFEHMMRELEPIRTRYDELKKNPQMIEEVLREGAKKAHEIAWKTMKVVREKVGI